MTSKEYYLYGFEKKTRDTYFFKGVCYSFGYGVEKNDELAKNAYSLGVKEGNAKCKYGLAVMLQKSKFEKDAAFATTLFLDAFETLFEEANHEDAISQRMVSCYYLFGDRGIKKDVDNAKKWLELAANNGDMEAQLNIGHCNETGTYFEQDIEVAKKWYRKAAAQGNEKAKRALLKIMD